LPAACGGWLIDGDVPVNGEDPVSEAGENGETPYDCASCCRATLSLDRTGLTVAAPYTSGTSCTPYISNVIGDFDSCI
jgi:hypothetical protein